jgi:hypothetical protein
MNSIIHHFIPPNHFTPPARVVSALYKMYGDLLNVEWFEEEKCYEAVFYHEGMETIARFSEEGELQVSKRNLPLHMVKPQVARQAEIVGELMNLIEITQHGTLFYEIIARDKYLDRYFLLLQENGAVIEKRKL